MPCVSGIVYSFTNHTVPSKSNLRIRIALEEASMRIVRLQSISSDVSLGNTGNQSADVSSPPKKIKGQSSARKVMTFFFSSMKDPF